MTRQRQLKTRIRARMDRTGESYLTARRHVLNATPPDEYQLRGGLHPETASMANAFANRGLEIPGTGEPINEALVLGIGGGLGAGYILWEFDDGDRRAVTTGFRNQWQYPQKWLAKVCDRLGVEAQLLETTGAVKAATQLDEALAAGTPTVVSISVADIGYWHLPTSESGWMGYPVTVYGRAGDDGYLVDDRNLGTLSVDAETLAAARGRISSYKNRLVVLDPAATEVDEATVVGAVVAGIHEQVEHLSAKSASFSIPAFAKWAKMLTAGKGKGWPVVFADGRGLLGALVSTVEAVDEVGILGGNLRALYAEFLDLGAGLIGADLGEAAEAYRAAAEAWAAVGRVPLEVSAVSAVVENDRGRRAAVAGGDKSAEEAGRLAQQSTELLDGDDAGLDEEQRLDLFGELASALEAAVQAERDALDALAVAAGDLPELPDLG